MTYPKHWALVPIPSGSKGPNTKGWNLHENCQLPPGWAGNVGLAHAYSGTCAIDVDRMADAHAYLLEQGIDLVEFFDDKCVQIDSGREGRAKLLYRLPEPLPSKQLAKGALELRCATADGLTVQDVLPPSVHPDTGQPYTWVGDPAKLPLIPDALLRLWQSLCVARPTPSAAVAPPPNDLRKLVFAHDPDAPYDADDGDSWLKVGMAIHAATDGSDAGLALWDEWSKTGAKYVGGLDSHWRSFKRGGITANWLRKGTTVEACDFSPLADVDDIDLTDDTIAEPKRIIAPAARVFNQLRRKRNGRIESNFLSIYSAMQDADRIGMHIGYDDFRAEIMRVPSGSPLAAMTPFEDEHYSDIRLELESFGFESTSVDNIRQAVVKLAKRNRFDSARDWLNGCHGDGAPRCATFLRDYLGAADTEYSRAVSLYLWTALAGRVLEPGIQADMAVILVGRQGCRKSTSVAALVPRLEQFVELSLDQEDDDLARQMSGCLVGELSELRGLTTRDLESIKGFITRKHEKWIPKYKEFANTYPRRLVLVGTTNKREFLADDTGERRFLPVEVTWGRPEAIKADLELLWAEARDLFELLGVAYQRAEYLAAEVTKEYKISDSWEETIALWLATGDGIDGSGEGRGERAFTTADVAIGALGYDARHINRGIEMRIGKIISGFGYELNRVRVGGIRSRVWERK